MDLATSDRSKASPNDARYGLEWVEEWDGHDPQWSKEPNTQSIEIICREELDVASGARCAVRFFAEGAFHKVYLVEVDKSVYIFRVPLPVDPSRKTVTEVATMSVVRRISTIPLPAIFAFDASNNNALHFEWMLMEFSPGTSLDRLWNREDFTWCSKISIVKELAWYHSQLYRRKFKGIGTLHSSCPTSQSDLGSMVAWEFYCPNHTGTSFVYGPFHNSFDWLDTRLMLFLQEQQCLLDSFPPCDDEDAQELKVRQNLACRLRQLLPKFFDPKAEQEETVIFHADLHQPNILVGSENKITAILDWESVSTLPLWMASNFPRCLCGELRSTKPNDAVYRPFDPEVDIDTYEENGGKSNYFNQHMFEWHLNELQPLYVNEMERLSPGWRAAHETGLSKRRFERMVDRLSHSISYGEVRDF